MDRAKTWFPGFIVLGAALLMLGSSGITAQGHPEARSFPDTTEGIHVFNDQIVVDALTDAQAEFAATHYAGAQKLTLSGAQRLRAYNPDFLVLHYRLGLGLGYRAADENCQPTGDYLAIVVGDEWVQEWPGEDALQEGWFYLRNGQRVYLCDWGWFLMDTGNPGWRAWWIDQVLGQLAANQNDGLFADSVNVPNHFGGDHWRPVLPDYDEAFEADWSRRIEDWMAWVRSAFGGQYALIVNAGAWVTTRDATDYSLADGVMVEGFAGWGEYSRFELGDWQLQMDRILALVTLDRIVLLQAYVWEFPERLWTLANYLLVKGNHTYVNLETSMGVEWFPEYDLPIGYPLTPLPSSVQGLQNGAGLYVRAYSNGLVLVNPDPSDSPITMTFTGPLYLVTGTTGGGVIPEDAVLSGWGVQATEVREVTVPPGQAAILLGQPVASAAPTTPFPEDAQMAAIAQAAVPGGLEASHRSGQTFLTWPEVPGNAELTYRVYRHTARLDAAMVGESTLIAEVPQGSGVFWTERARALESYYDQHGYKSLRNYVITELGPPLADGTGLFVWTTHEDGDFYYAVSAADGSFFAAAGPVREQVSDPAPILVYQSPDGLSRVYTQFMDYAAYNPTFDAPRPTNSYMGLPNWSELEKVGNQQYAYNYWVGLPTAENCGGTVPARVPLILRLEGWGSRYETPEAAPYWCAAMLWGDDPNQSWYFGFSATHDYRTGDPVTTGPIANYTEARLLQAVHDTVNTLVDPAIDVNRIYVYGHSMGGTGALMMAERYPDIFAAAAASEPMMDFAAATTWIEELEGKWGARSLNLPVELRGLDAAELTAYQGTGVWDWQNLGEQLAARRGDEMAFIAIAHGTMDTVIDWQTVVQPSYLHFYEGRRAFIGESIENDHTWLGFREHPNWRFDAMTFRRDESLPALAYASGSAPMPPEGVGNYNMTLEWSASWNAFAGPPVDTHSLWSVALRSMAGVQTVDVTPRRLQQFEVIAAMPYRWQNVRLSDGSVIQEGVVVADADRLITVEDFQVTESGNWLVLQPQ